jgi:hypothetical protein
MSTLRGFNSVFDTTINNEIQDNVVEFLDWGLLEKGNYFNVKLGELDSNNRDISRLHTSNNEHFAPGKAWESFYTNWVWQSGINYIPAPIIGNNNTIPGISGVYINNIFYPSSTTGQYSHKVDYFNGRIIFNSPIPTGSKVQAEYSYKYISVIYANSVPWLREIENRSILENKQIQNALPSEMTIRLPAIAVEMAAKRTMKGFQLGGGQYVDTDILFHCIAEDDITRNTLTDIISYQNDRSITIFNTEAMANDNSFPINIYGYPVSGALTYPQIVSKYPGYSMFLKNLNVQDALTINSNLYVSVIRLTTEIIANQL